MKDYEPSDERSIERQPAVRNELAGAATEKTLKRARWEHLRLAACPGARRVNVCNYSYGVAAARSGEHTYTVTIGVDGLPTDCTCPAAEYRPGPCKHAVKVADAPDVIAEAMHASDPEPTSDGDAPRAVADGGSVESGESGAGTGGGIEDTQPDGEPSDADYCAKYIVPAADCVLSDGEDCPHDVLTDGGQPADDRRRFDLPDGPDHDYRGDDWTFTADCAGCGYRETFDLSTEAHTAEERHETEHAPDETCHAVTVRVNEDDDIHNGTILADESTRERPTRSEPADFGGGEGGIDEL